MKVQAIVVNYRTAEMTLDAVRALLVALERIPDSHVIVVDNDSQDGSYEKLLCAARKMDGRVTVLGSDKNGGFGYGVNIGLRYGLLSSSPAEYFYLLNSDAFPDPSAVGELLQVLEREPSAGIAGSYIYGLDGIPHQTAFRFPSPISELERALRLGIASKILSKWRVTLPIPDTDREVDWVAGASMMIRREVFADVGGFDEAFFLYFEETDFCLRAKQAGWSTQYVRNSAVAHIGSVSTGLKDHRRRMPQYWFDSRHHYFKKNHGRVYLTLSDLLFALGFSLWRVRRKIQRKPDEDPPALLADFIRHSVRARSSGVVAKPPR